MTATATGVHQDLGLQGSVGERGLPSFECYQAQTETTFFSLSKFSILKTKASGATQSLSEPYADRCYPWKHHGQDLASSVSCSWLASVTKGDSDL